MSTRFVGALAAISAGLLAFGASADKPREIVESRTQYETEIWALSPTREGQLVPTEMMGEAVIKDGLFSVELRHLIPGQAYDVCLLHAGLFTDTANDWVLPYLANMIGMGTVFPDPESNRADMRDVLVPAGLHIAPFVVVTESSTGRGLPPCRSTPVGASTIRVCVHC